MGELQTYKDSCYRCLESNHYDGNYENWFDTMQMSAYGCSNLSDNGDEVISTRGTCGDFVFT